MSKILKIEGIFFVLNEWRVVINKEIFQRMKDKLLYSRVYLLDSTNKVIAEASFMDLKPLPNYKTSLSFDLVSNVNDEEVRKTTSFIFKDDLS